MLGRKLWIPGLALLLCGVAILARAESHQEAAPAAMEVAPSLFFVWTDHVPMANAIEYEGEVRRMLGEMAATEAGAGIRFVGLSDVHRYTYVMPMREMADFERINLEMFAAIEAAGGLENWDTASRLVDHGSGQFLMLRSDLSYTPAEPRDEEATGQFRLHEWWYVKPGHEGALEKVAKRLVELYREKAIDTGWRIYQAVTGEDLPLYVVSVSASSAADGYANEERVNEALGAEAVKLILEAGSHTRRMERTTAVMRSDLSLGM